MVAFPENHTAVLAVLFGDMWALRGKPQINPHGTLGEHANPWRCQMLEDIEILKMHDDLACIPELLEGRPLRLFPNGEISEASLACDVSILWFACHAAAIPPPGHPAHAAAGGKQTWGREAISSAKKDCQVELCVEAGSGAIGPSGPTRCRALGGHRDSTVCRECAWSQTSAPFAMRSMRRERLHKHMFGMLWGRAGVLGGAVRLCTQWSSHRLSRVLCATRGLRSLGACTHMFLGTWNLGSMISFCEDDVEHANLDMTLQCGLGRHKLTQSQILRGARWVLVGRVA